jgi:very-short-patch-repair endonuclease
MPIPQAVIDRNRLELLDLTTRNRLLSIPIGSSSARLIHVRNELTPQVYRHLVGEKKSMNFVPAGGNGKPGGPLADGAGTETGDREDVGLGQPDDDTSATASPAKRHVDVRLQTALTSEGLQRRLLDLYRDAQTMLEEQGVNILYLALGQLKWFEATDPQTPRFAPLILLPVELERAGAAERFRLSARTEDVEENLSLAEKLKVDFGIELPPFGEPDDFDPTDYLQAVAGAVAKIKKWEVVPNAMTLGFFSFAKFLMYRDLDAENWPAPAGLLSQPLLAGLMQDGLPAVAPLFPEGAHLDEVISVEKLDHVVDADASQTAAIENVRRGHDLVIQGPPGTGKSQSITNIIATAVLDGKRVLFIAEKLAALEVVKGRLARAGLGPLCLELHSNKANKRAVLEEIARTWKQGRPALPAELDLTVARLEAKRGILNSHAAALHRSLSPSDLAPFTIIGRLQALGDPPAAARPLILDGAERWTRQEYGERGGLVADLCERIGRMGLPQVHPWRGVQRETLLKIDFDRIRGRIEAANAGLLQAKAAADAVAEFLRKAPPVSLSDSEPLLQMGRHLAAAPALDRQALCHGIWDAGVDSLRDIVHHGLTFSHACRELGSRVTPDVWTMDFRSVRQAVAAHGDSLFRVLQADYRQALAKLKGALTTTLPPKTQDRLELLDQIIVGQQAKSGLDAAEASGRMAFGRVWMAERTDWTLARAILDWTEACSPAGFGATSKATVAALGSPEEAGRLTQKLAERSAALENTLSALFDELQFSSQHAFGSAISGRVPFAELQARFAVWLQRPEDLSLWVAYWTRAKLMRRQGLAQLVERLEHGDIAAKEGRAAFDYVYLCQVFREAARLVPELAQFDGEEHSRHIEEFRTLDRDRLALARYRVLAAHHEHLPPVTGAVGATGIVRGELERKRGHRTIRRLLKDAGSVVQTIKPVFMMSPLSVAQFLEPGAVEFDLLVIDEASQVQPVDALGAIARSRQIVVVGDSRQLPPTRFFQRITADTPDTEDPEDTNSAAARDVESILGLCRARGIPERMLRWHYRSRHHSLIAVSNQEFYNNQLFIVPSPRPVAPGLGLRFHHVPDGVFDRGGSSTNAVEAHAVARAVIQHARDFPNQSLGVAAFGLKQQQAILDELELLRRENPETEPFFSVHANEPFFVKNLESVQGDERDVIFISVGYGRDRGGNLTMAFGPLGAEGGERRLNVLITRAKFRCEVFSSLTASDIDLSRAAGRGVGALKSFLAFAQNGQLKLPAAAGHAPDAPFEESVRRAVESLGHEVHRNVGLAGIFVDLALVDPAESRGYVLGIEFDGVGYEASRSARDRDRLRQAVLEDHGWHLHRVWSVDWFQSPAEQLQRIAAAIEKARSALAASRVSGLPAGLAPSPLAAPPTADDIGREPVTEMAPPSALPFVQPYSEVDIEVPRGEEPHEVSVKQMAEIVFEVVRHEGPIHEDEVATRVRGLWGLQRAGNRIHDAVARATRSLLVKKRCVREDGCLFLPGATIPVRSRVEVRSASLKKLAYLPGAEIRAAILALLEFHHGAAPSEIPTAVARVFGFKSAGASLRSLCDYQLKKLLKSGAAVESDGMLRVAKATAKK